MQPTGSAETFFSGAWGQTMQGLSLECSNPNRLRLLFSFSYRLLPHINNINLHLEILAGHGHDSCALQKSVS